MGNDDDSTQLGRSGKAVHVTEINTIQPDPTGRLVPIGMALMTIAPIRMMIRISSDAAQRAVNQKLHSQGIEEENNNWKSGTTKEWSVGCF